jgi:hypothetical protein
MTSFAEYKNALAPRLFRAPCSHRMLWVSSSSGSCVPGWSKDASVAEPPRSIDESSCITVFKMAAVSPYRRD